MPRTGMDPRPAAPWLLALSLAACNPYERRDGEFFAGPVDPARFAAPYLGDGGVGGRPGSGTFAPVSAHAKGAEVSYYAFPLPDAQAELDDPLLLTDLAVPPAYVFDPRADDPSPSQQRCKAPDGYRFDQQQDGYRLDQQGDVFTALPSAADYVPIVAQVPVTAAGQPCQDIKSEEALEARSGAGKADGKYLARAIIDPAADVLSPGDVPLPDGSLPKEAALGPQAWGWYQHYLLGYLDGGYLPTRDGAMGRRLVPQRLYYPQTMPSEDEMGMVTLVPGRPGAGFDVLEAARGAAGYSPLCQVLSYKPADPMKPATDVAQIDMMTVTDDQTFVYCLQLK